MTRPLWSILICTMPEREGFFLDLLRCLQPQLEGLAGEVEVLTDDRIGITIGQKRNDLVNASEALYTSFIDDDDLVAEDYIESHLLHIKDSEPDGIGFYGILTRDGAHPEKFIHSDKYDTWFEKKVTSGNEYYRCLNHWNVVKNHIRKAAPFPEISYGEDHAHSIDMKLSGLINKSTDITHAPMYFYQYRRGISITSKQQFKF